MNRTISIRITPERDDLLRRAKVIFNVEKNSDAIDLALKISVKDLPDFDKRLKDATGCIKPFAEESAVAAVRRIREDL